MESAEETHSSGKTTVKLYFLKQLGWVVIRRAFNAHMYKKIH